MASGKLANARAMVTLVESDTSDDESEPYVRENVVRARFVAPTLRSDRVENG